MTSLNVTVLGDGGWGTTLAILLSRRGKNVTLWSAFPEYAEFLAKKRENTKFLPGAKIPKSIKITSDLEGALKDIPLIILAIPTAYLRNILFRLKKIGIKKKVVVSAAKGIERKTLLRPSEIVSLFLDDVSIAVLSGPSHAEEVVRDIPTCVVVASRDRVIAQFVQRTFMEERFRVYTSDDMIGVEVGAAMKNVVAIAAGASDGLGFGSNTKAALLCRGLMEITRLGVKMGANANTFFGLSGLGDLATTCMSDYSRNRRVGLMLAKGKSLKEIMASTEMVAEGIETARSALDLSKKYDVEMPIAAEVYRVLYENKEPRRAVEDLMLREAKPELEPYQK